MLEQDFGTGSLLDIRDPPLEMYKVFSHLFLDTYLL